MNILFNFFVEKPSSLRSKLFSKSKKKPKEKESKPEKSKKSKEKTKGIIIYIALLSITYITCNIVCMVEVSLPNLNYL